MVAQEWLPALILSERRRADGEALDDSLVEAEACLITLRLMMVERRLQEISRQMAAAERAGDNARRDQLALEHFEWTKYRHSLRA